MKPFEKHNKQLLILRQRGLNVPSYAKRNLEDENYYNIINGYKDLFLSLNSQGQPLVPDAYKPGTHFDEIFSLYKLDRRLRNIILEYLLVFETQIKSRIAYSFSEEYKEPHSYLYFKNYSSDPKKTNDIVRMVATISNTMSNKNKGPLKHYINNHNGVPLWVLVNYLTIGTISYMYNNLEDSLRIEIAESYNEKYKKQYNKTIIHLLPKDVDAALQQVNMFRNVCAHEERLYDFRIFKPKSINNLVSIYNRVSTHNFQTRSFDFRIYTLLFTLRFFLNKRDHRKLISNIEKAVDYYSKDFKTITIQDIYNKMGNPHNDLSHLIL